MAMVNDKGAERIVTLQKVDGLKRGDKTYYRWQVTIPMEVVRELGWEKGDYLAVIVKSGTVTLKKMVLTPG